MMAPASPARSTGSGVYLLAWNPWNCHPGGKGGSGCPETDTRYFWALAAAAALGLLFASRKRG